jgi:hypothetical protein
MNKLTSLLRFAFSRTLFHSQGQKTRPVPHSALHGSKKYPYPIYNPGTFLSNPIKKEIRVTSLCEKIFVAGLASQGVFTLYVLSTFF